MQELLSFRRKSDRFEWWTISLSTSLTFQLSLLMTIVTLQWDHPVRSLPAGGLIVGAAVSFWLSVAVGVRRIRDRGYAPWLLIFALVPYLGQAWYLINCGFLAAPGSRRKKRRLVRRQVSAGEGG